MITKGKIKTCKSNEDGKDFITAIHSPNNFLAYYNIIADNNHSETAIALEDSECVIIPRNDFEKLLISNREISAYLIKLLSNKVIREEDRLLSLAYNSVRKRVADGLLEVAESMRLAMRVLPSL